MISAIVLCKSSSSRFPNKHFEKIGDNRIIDIILEKLSKNKNISQIYIATGNKKENLIFSKLIKNKDIKYFYHKKDNEVTNRINKLCRTIKGEYSMVISGDCPLIDNDYINRLYNQFKLTKKEADFIVPNKKVIHEGIFLFRTKSWEKINNLSNNKYFQEHPASVIKYKYSQFKKSVLRIKDIEKKRKLRMSVDTYSDLKYLNIILKFTKKKSLNFKDLIKYNILNILNIHVAQRKIFRSYNEKINIFININRRNKSNKYSEIIAREIRETISTNINIIYLKNEKILKNLNMNKRNLNILCLDNDSKNKYQKLKNYRKNIIIESHGKKISNYVKVSSKKVNNKKIFINNRNKLENYLLKNSNMNLSKIKQNIKKKFSKIGCSGIVKEVLRII